MGLFLVQCFFLGHFLPTLERVESLTGKAFVADAAEKWRNLDEEEKHKHFQVRLLKNEAGYTATKVTCWPAGAETSIWAGIVRQKLAINANRKCHGPIY